MMITVVFEESKPTEKMWTFAKTIASTLDIDIPEYTFEAVSAFIEANIHEFYQFKRVVSYDIWAHAFWMDNCLTQEEIDAAFYEHFIKD